MELIAKYLKIYGKVQGVYFRESLRMEAEKLGVCGWVRNRKDGSVEAFIQGPANILSALVEWAHKGPTQARVDKLESLPAIVQDKLSTFVRKETL